MELDFSPALGQLQRMLDGLVRLLPSLMVGLLIFLMFYSLSLLAAGTARRISDRYGRQKNLGVVLTANESRRLEYLLGIGYGDDVEEARRLVYAALEGCTTVLPVPKPEVLLVELAPSSVNLLVRWWISPPRRRDTFDSQDEVLTAIKQQMNTHGVDLPYPTYQVLFHDQTEESDGDRLRQREGWPARRGDVAQPRLARNNLHL